MGGGGTQGWKGGAGGEVVTLAVATRALPRPSHVPSAPSLSPPPRVPAPALSLDGYRGQHARKRLRQGNKHAGRLAARREQMKAGTSPLISSRL